MSAAGPARFAEAPGKAGASSVAASGVAGAALPGAAPAGPPVRARKTGGPGIMNRRGLDVFFTRLFRLTSLTAVLALASILIFVFVQGTAPFVLPGAPGIRIVTERIDEIEVNGRVYRPGGNFIELPRNTGELSLAFALPEKEERLRVRVEDGEKGREKKLVLAGDGELSSPEAYTYTITYPATIPAMSRKIHIILPEEPYRLGAFLGGMEWRPVYNKQYGIFPMILGTLAVSFAAILLGLPPALLSGLFLAEFPGEKPAALIRGGIELLAGIPSVVYGFFGLMVIVPGVKRLFHVPSGNGLLSAALVLGVMILPTVTLITETSLRGVPQSCREASLALGASRMQTLWFVTLPHARSGVIAAAVLGISRAVGETMALILVAGNSAQMIRGLTDSVRTLTATIALEMGYSGGRHSQMLFSIGVVLFILILILNSIILGMRRGGEEG